MSQMLDKIFYNCTVYTMENEKDVYDAIGIKDGRIAFLGTSEEAKNIGAAESVDLNGKFVLPAFTDGHMHLVNYANAEMSVKYNGCKTAEEVMQRAKEYYAAHKNAKWIYGRGWNHEYFTEKRYPLRKELDEVSTEIPIIAVRVCGHIGVCNTCALEKIRALPEFAGQEDNLDYETGLVKENVAQLFYHILDKQSIEYLKELIKLGVKNLNKCGITGCQCDDFSSMPKADWRYIMQGYKELEAEGELNARIYEQCLFMDIDSFREFLDAGNRTGDGKEFFKIGPLKLLSDGSLGARTAALEEPYIGTDSRGIAAFTQQQLDDLLELAQKNDMQIAVHCIGDRGMNMTLDALEKAQKKYPREDCRHGIVHVQISSYDILDRMARDKVIAYIQPVFVPTDMDIVEERIGRERMKGTYAWNTMVKLGIPTVGGSDAPIESFDVIDNIYFAVTREKKNGFPAGGWMPEEKVSVWDAVKMFTVNPSYSCFNEKNSGTLAEGKYADIVVLSDDIFKAEPHAIKDISVLMTLIGGKTVYTKEA
jgi:predicted amidohydrolase YtcJ